MMKKELFNITGMHCAGCAANVERAVKKLQGVSNVYVSIASKTMALERDPKAVSVEEIAAAVRKIGFKAELVTKENQGREVEDEEQGSAYFHRFMTALVFSILLFYAAMHHMFGLPYFSVNGNVNAWIQLFLTVPIVAAGIRFYTSGFKTLFRFAPNMDSLIALCTSAAIVYSLFLMARGETAHLYFDTAGMIVALIMLGKYLEARSRRRASGAIRELMNLTPPNATLVVDGRETKVAVAALKAGDLIRVRPGEKIPVDGVIVDGGKFDWTQNDKFPGITKPNPSYHGVVFSEACGNIAYVMKIRTTLMRDQGATISPFNSFLLLQGLETLSLRVERHVENALKVVEFLKKHPKVVAVNHPSLPEYPDHALYGKYFPNGGGSIFTFEVRGGVKEAQTFIDSLQIFSLLANVADVKSLVIHPATTTHSQLSARELEEQGIKPGTVRLSIGTEHIDDLLDDLSQAFDRI